MNFELIQIFPGSARLSCYIYICQHSNKLQSFFMSDRECWKCKFSMKLQFQNVLPHQEKVEITKNMNRNNFRKLERIVLLSIFNYFQEDFEGCLKKAQKSSAFQLGFQNDGGLYFQHGHSRCLSNGNYDPIQCVDLSGDTDLWCVFLSA
jgi:hypothetical protein